MKIKFVTLQTIIFQTLTPLVTVVTVLFPKFKIVRINKEGHINTSLAMRWWTTGKVFVTQEKRDISLENKRLIEKSTLSLETVTLSWLTILYNYFYLYVKIYENRDDNYLNINV